MTVALDVKLLSDGKLMDFDCEAVKKETFSGKTLLIFFFTQMHFPFKKISAVKQIKVEI